MVRKLRKPTDTVHLKLRLEERLRRRLEKAAELHLFSMNREIIERLERSFADEDQATQFDELRRAITAQVNKLTQQFTELGEKDFKVIEECRAEGIDVMQVLREALNRTRSQS